MLPRYLSNPVPCSNLPLKELGKKMSNWHNGMDSVYAVGSYAFSGRVHPQQDVIESAKREIDRLIPQAERHLHGWTDEDAAELRCISEALSQMLAGGYGV